MSCAQLLAATLFITILDTIKIKGVRLKLTSMCGIYLFISDRFMKHLSQVFMQYKCLCLFKVAHALLLFLYSFRYFFQFFMFICQKDVGLLMLTVSNILPFTRAHVSSDKLFLSKRIFVLIYSKIKT